MQDNLNTDSLKTVSADSTFAQVPTGVLKAGVSSRAIHVYAIVRTYLRPGHPTFPKYSTVAEDFGVSESTIKRGLEELKEHGLIQVTEHRYAGGWRRGNRYHFPHIPDPVNSDLLGEVNPDLTGETQPDLAAGSSADLAKKVEELKAEERKSREVAKRPSPKRGTRLPSDWMPKREVVDQMRAECPNVNLEAEHRKFVDHWGSTPGAKGVKLDWNGTWRNWIRRANEFQGGGKPAPAQRMADTASLGARLQAQYDQKELL